MTIDELVREAHKIAVDKGWHEAGDPPFAESIALVHSELSEALEEWRNGRGLTDIYLNPEQNKPEGVPIELADVVIRVAHLCGTLGIDLTDAIERKLVCNRMRSHRHGGRRA